MNIDSKQMKVYLRCRRQDETRCTFRAMEATEQLHVHVHPYWSRAVILTDINQICGVRQSCKGTEQLKTSHISCVNNVIDLNQLSLLSWLSKWSCHDFQGNFGHPNKRSNFIFIGPHKTVGLRPTWFTCDLLLVHKADNQEGRRPALLLGLGGSEPPSEMKSCKGNPGMVWYKQTF